MGKTATDTITEFAKQTQGVFFANPMAAPHIEKILQAQENALQEAQAFTENWFARRHTATKSALKAAQGITKNGGSDPTEFAKGMTDWQRHSMERIAEDFQEWIDLCTRCAGHFVSAEVEAEKEGLQETLKRTKAVVKSKHATPV